MLKTGVVPSLEEVAEKARVSRATAYRYFSNVEALVAEAPLDHKVPSPEDLFCEDASKDPVERLDRADAALDEMIRANEPQLRVMLARTLEAKRSAADRNPVRQNRRTPLVEAALAPARHRFGQESYDNLVAALALVLGTESMVVARDVLGIDFDRMRAVKSWAIRALVAAALDNTDHSPVP